MLEVRIASPEERPQLFDLRHVVFVEEQRVPADEELDAYEEVCTHFGAWRDGVLLGTARLRIDPDKGAKAERVAVGASARGLGVGRRLMEALHDEARRLGHRRVVLSSQLSALPFYARLGYVAWGPVYLDAGIRHRMMGKDLEPKEREEVFALSEEVAETLAVLRPTAATFWGLPGHDFRWDDLSVAGHARVEAALRGFRARVPPPTGEPSADLARDVLVDLLDLELARCEAGDPLSDLNCIASPDRLFRMAFDTMDRASAFGWADLVERLETLDAALRDYVEGLLEGARRGDPPPVRQVRAALLHARLQAGPDSFFRRLPDAFLASEVDAPGLHRRVERGVQTACAAWARFADRLEGELLPRARAEDPVGRARYLREARRHLGAALEPEAAYLHGWAEIERLREQMREAAAAIARDRSLEEVTRSLRSDPAYALGGPDALVAFYRDRLDAALPELERHFTIPDPVRRLDVRAAPPGGPVGAYYVPPSEDFARPGCVWISRPEGPVPVFDQASTAYHEGFPGHHLQLGVQLAASERLSLLHRVADGPSGHAEGWALYAEQLMEELGFLDDPVDRFGLLACRMTRACRVVIDIGCHLELPIPDGQPFHPGGAWSRALGIEMLVELAGLTPAHAASELDRYLGWPAQAITYELGRKAFVELREEARRRAGDRFDLKAFHDRVLACGTLGLDRLRSRVLDAGVA